MALGRGSDCLYPVYIPTSLKKMVYQKSKDGKLHGHYKYDNTHFMRVRCGYCINCKSYKMRENTLRLAMESKDPRWKDSICFVTLTYCNDDLPKMYLGSGVVDDTENTYEDSTLYPKDVKDFIKRLRKRFDYYYGRHIVRTYSTWDLMKDGTYKEHVHKVYAPNHPFKYFVTGEYGLKYQRPHYHIMFFGLNETDVKALGYTVGEFLTWKRGTLLPEYQRYIAWTKGHVDVRPFYPETCCYIAGYVQKKLYGSDKHLTHIKEFKNQSQHLGQWYFDNYVKPMVDDNHAFIMFNDYKHPIPRYFRKQLYAEGILSPLTLEDVYCMQHDEYLKLIEKCKKLHCTVSEYFENRRKLGEIKVQRLNAPRNKYEEEHKDEVC